MVYSPAKDPTTPGEEYRIPGRENRKENVEGKNRV